MKVTGQCPVQGYAIIDGWLYYFRARQTWQLYAWAPDRWRKVAPDNATAFRAVCSLSYGCGGALFDSPDILIDTPGEGFPVPVDGEEPYPGWWSAEYANAVARWAIGEAQRRIAEVVAC